ncbi:MAG: GTP-binding protein [Candidatus Natronoplasma sp.]
MNGAIKRKVNLLGESGVGKTSLILQFVKNVFGEEYLKTVGTNVYTKKVPVTGSEVKLVMYDIMGEADFESVREMAFENSTGAIAVADITREETLYKLIDNWLPKYRRSAVDNAPIILTVNKIDLEDQEITREDVVDNVLSYFDAVFFTSAKTGENVEDLFHELGFRTMYRRTSPVRHAEDIVTIYKMIDTPKKLISGLLTYASDLGSMLYSTMDDLIDQTGINKFSMAEEITEDKALKFGERLMRWYEDNDDLKSASTVRRLIEKYREDSEPRPKKL